MSISMLFAYGALAFIFSGVLNIFSDFLPESATRFCNFIGVAVGILGITAVYLYQRRESGVFGFISYVLTLVGFIGIAGFLFVDAFVFPSLDMALQEQLTNGETGLAIFASVILYVVGSLLFCIASLRAGVYSKLPLFLWMIGVLPTMAATSLPSIVMTIAEIILSIGIIWIGLIIWQNADKK